MHYKNDMDRIPMALINVQQGLNDPRLFFLKKNTSEFELVAVLSAQIKNLADFLNIGKNFSSAQIVDTAELILNEFDDLSFTAIADCINKIKSAAPPFDSNLFQSIDGRKLLEYFHRYRDHQIDILEQSHRAVKASEPEGFTAFRDPNIAEKLKGLSVALTRENALAKINQDKMKPSPERSQLDEQIHQWTNDFNKEIKEPYAGQLDEYLKQKLNDYQKQNP
jgi:primosomal protein N''